MAIHLTAALAWYLFLPSKPRRFHATPIWAQGSAHGLVQQLIQKAAPEYLAPEDGHPPPPFSDETPFSVWLLLASLMAVSISMGVALLNLMAVPVQ